MLHFHRFSHKRRCALALQSHLVTNFARPAPRNSRDLLVKHSRRRPNRPSSHKSSSTQEFLGLVLVLALVLALGIGSGVGIGSCAGVTLALGLAIRWRWH